MALTTYYAKRGDVGSVTPKTLLIDGAGAAVNLTGASVRFVMTGWGATSPMVAADAEVVDDSTGEVRYTWLEGDLDVPGLYRAEWEVTYAGEGAGIETFPADGYITVWVRSDLDAES